MVFGAIFALLGQALSRQKDCRDLAVNNAHFHALHRPYQVFYLSVKNYQGRAKSRCHQ